MSDFRKVLDDNQLVEAVHSGVTYTWWNKQLGRNKIISKLDKMFINWNWLDKYVGWSYKALNRLSSDHSPLVGRTYHISKPHNTPFRFMDMWCSHPSFLPLVEENWHGPIDGNPFYVLIQKLKRLKLALKTWNKEYFGHIQNNIRLETKVLEDLQLN
ncbi:hypothetical protein IFM89_008883 [Coptis chinensis]|uniref:Uncharacterized protein n=1 Tax=Coptis chinensis TaxID=261450 RepID=A0A835HUT0_9MAGN|nr:hypothetical protein IFM89_008883 [Coptis chinensis]